MLNLIATFAFDSPVPLNLNLGTGTGYAPMETQGNLNGIMVYQQAYPVSPAILPSSTVSYTFVVPADYPVPFTFGEFTLVSPVTGVPYAVGVLSSPITKLVGSEITIVCYFNTSTAQVTAFGNTFLSVQQTNLLYLNTPNLLPPVASSVSNVYIIGNPVNTKDSLIGFSNPSSVDPNDFASWGFSNYSLVSSGTVNAVLGNTASINYAATPLNVPGEFIFQTPQYVHVSGVSSSAGNSLVYLDAASSAATIAGTPYKLYQYSGVTPSTSSANSFINNLTVTPSQINTIAGIQPSHIVLSDGSVAMTAALNLGGNPIIQVASAAGNLSNAATYKDLIDATGNNSVFTNGVGIALASLTAQIETLQAQVQILMIKVP